MEAGSFFDKIEKIKMPIRILILLGTIVVMSGLFIWFYYIPKDKEIKKTEDQIKTLKQKLFIAEKKAREKEKTKAEYEKVDIEFQEALKLLPNTKEIPSLLRSITQLGSDSQLEFRLFSPQREQPRDFYMEIPVSIEVSGSYHNVAVFFDMVGRMERIVNILNVSMKPAKARSTNLITTCDAVTYRFKGGSDVEETKKKKK